MTTDTVSLTLAVVALLIAGAALAFGVRAHQLAMDARPAAHRAPAYDPREQLTEPPMVDGQTLRNYLVHRTARPNAWAESVTEFYDRAASVPQVAAYFTAVLARPGGRERLEQHFTRQLVVIAHTGVNRGMVERVREQHARVRTPDGRPVDGDTWDLVIGTLAGVLAGKGVPAATLEQLGATVAPLRAAIVHDGNGTSA